MGVTHLLPQSVVVYCMSGNVRNDVVLVSLFRDLSSTCSNITRPPFHCMSDRNAAITEVQSIWKIDWQ